MSKLNSLTTSPKATQQCPLESRVLTEIFFTCTNTLLKDKDPPFLRLLSLYLFGKDEEFCEKLLQEIEKATSEEAAITLNGLKMVIDQHQLTSYRAVDRFLTIKKEKLKRQLFEEQSLY